MNPDLPGTEVLDNPYQYTDYNGIRSVAVPVRDGTGTVRAAMNVTVHAAETTTQRLTVSVITFPCC